MDAQQSNPEKPLELSELATRQVHAITQAIAQAEERQALLRKELEALGQQIQGLQDDLRLWQESLRDWELRNNTKAEAPQIG